MEEPTTSNQIEPPPVELTKELMVSLSKEIETTMNGITEFRTKIGFGMFVGPFVLLGSLIVGAKGERVSFNLTRWGWLALVVDVACFLAIGWVAAKVEAQAYEKCNDWRKLISKLRHNPAATIDESDLHVNHKAYGAYLLSFFLLFFSVVAAVVIITSINS